MSISKTYSSVAVISLLGLASVAQVGAQGTGGEIESFNRSLGLDEMSGDLANVEHELSHGSPANTAETPERPEGPQSQKKAPAQKRTPLQQTESFGNLSFRANPGVTNTVRAYYVSRMNAASLINAPDYDSLINRFDERFSNYDFPDTISATLWPAT